MVKLTEATEVFIASLEKAQAELEWISNQLEDEFSKRYKSTDINPLDLLFRIHKIQHDLPAIAKECAEVLQVKQEISEVGTYYLLGNAEILKKLHRKAGIEEDSNDEEMIKAYKSAVGELDAKLTIAGSALSSGTDGKSASEP